MVDDSSLNDEYHLDDLDAVSTQQQADTDAYSQAEGTSKADVREKLNSLFSQFGNPETKRILLRTLIFLVGAITIWMAYKLVSSMVETAKKSKQHQMTAVHVTKAPQTKPQISQMPDIAQSENVPVSEVTAMPAQTSPDLDRRLSTMEVSQQSTRSEMAAINNQLTNVNINLNELAQKMGDLNQVLTELSEHMEEQSKDMQRLRAMMMPKRPKPPKHVRKAPPAKKYYLQAVIPGRAWLMATDGTTLTVREGTVVAGLGVIKLIDPLEGRVVTDSDRVIQFSQQDS